MLSSGIFKIELKALSCFGDVTVAIVRGIEEEPKGQ
jgi:hypothetical protein